LSTSSGRLSLGPDASGTIVVVEGDRIVNIRRGAAAPRVEDVPGTIALPCPSARWGPGRVNAHTHLYSALAPLGLPRPAREPSGFLEILSGIWWRLDRALDAASLRAAARLYVAEALLAGTTTLVDHHESPGFVEGSLDVLAGAFAALGGRAVLCFGATERNAGRDEARRGLAECRRFLASDRPPLVEGAVGLHASFTVSDESAREAGHLARELGTVVHLHVAEDRADVEDARRRGWPGPLERLLALGALPPGSVLAHGVHLTVDEVRAAEDHGLWIVQNPRSNRGNRVGYPGALRASRRVALGTDGFPARMHEEEAVLGEEAARHGDEAEACAARADAGRALAAELYGREFALAPGAVADLVAWEGEAARHVVAGGRLVVRDGRLVDGDLDDLRAEAATQAPGLWARMNALPED
jgi:cytosine/adenosine deaminase-related metal-dependent hydrolase